MPTELVYTAEPREADVRRDDGGFAPVVGVTNIQIVRANRSHPELADGTGFTYKHAPNIAHWQGHFYVNWVNGPRSEHEPPCHNMFTRSPDGVNWEKPRPLFDSWRQGDSETISHQRMSFYITKDRSQLLAVGFFGLMPSPNSGAGVGRVVREIKPDGSLGPIFFLRYNPNYGEHNTPYKLYKTSDDPRFIAACEELLADKLIMQQCQEEDSKATDDFYALSPKVSVTKAFCFWTLPDGRVAGVWKGRQFTVAEKWEPGKIPPPRTAPTLPEVGSKYWVQRTSDGRYALVCNPTGGNWSYRFPLAVSTGSNGLTFDTPYLSVHGERNRPRFWGDFKDSGPQYIRGIEETYPKPDDAAMWLTYSMNKEDIWVSRVPVPIRGQADDGDLIDEDFAGVAQGSFVPKWNIYSPAWARVAVVNADGRKALRLSDQDPYDYAKAVRVFPATATVRVELDLHLRQAGQAPLWIELLDRRGRRPVRVGILPGLRELVVRVGSQSGRVVLSDLPNDLRLELSFDAAAKRFDVVVNGQPVASAIPGADEVTSVERLELRTGPYRNHGNDRLHLYADSNKPSDDLVGADEAVAETIVDVRRVVIRGQPLDRGSVSAVEVESVPGAPARSYSIATAVTSARYYLDRDYAIRKLPDRLIGAILVPTANDDDSVPSDRPLMRLRLAKPATVYVAYGKDGNGTLPVWLGDWNREADVIEVEQRTVGLEHQLLSRRFPAGEVILHGNARDDTGAKSNYFVLVKPE